MALPILVRSDFGFQKASSPDSFPSNPGLFANAVWSVGYRLVGGGAAQLIRFLGWGSLSDRAGPTNDLKNFD